MATLTSLGLGSGLDANAIVSQLMALERKPIEQLQTEAGKIDARLSSFGRIQGALDGLRSAARTLTDAGAWRAASASSGDPAAVGVSVTSAASPGSYAVQVGTLAATQLNATGALASSTATLGQGTITLDIGRWDGTNFIAKSGSTPLTITIGSGEDTLDKVRDKINATAGSPVRASIVNDANGARLVLQSRDSGAENGFRVRVSDSDSNDGDALGLSRLAYDPGPGGVGAISTRNQPARNATAVINGLAVESASNSLANVIDGVSLNLAKVTTGSVDVTVTRDTAAMKKSVDGFVSAYNDLVKLLRDQTKYDAGSKAAGTLQGDRTAIGILGQLRGVLGGTSSASSVFTRASDVGLGVQTDGTIKLTGSKLDEGFAKLEELQKFFATSGTTDAASGLAERLRRITDTMLGAEGAVPSRQEGLRRLKEANSDRQQTLEDRVALTEKRLRAQYQALDASMARLTSLQNYVGQQITNWNKSG